MLKSIIFLVKSFLGNFYRHLAIFSGHTDCKLKGCQNCNELTEDWFVLISSLLRGHATSLYLSNFRIWTAEAVLELISLKQFAKIVQFEFWLTCHYKVQYFQHIYFDLILKGMNFNVKHTHMLLIQSHNLKITLLHILLGHSDISLFWQKTLFHCSAKSCFWAVWPEENRQMSIKLAQNWLH